MFNVYPQTDIIELEQFSVSFSGNKMLVFEMEKVVNERTFNNPSGYAIDFDGDSLKDFLVVDQFSRAGTEEYMVYIYNTIDTFYLADSIHSSYVEPYFTLSEESEEMVIVAGNSVFAKLDTISRIALPVNCYRYESGEVLLINDELYDIFIQENEDIVEYIEQYFHTNPVNCISSKQILSAISAAYANYINAGEPTLAHQLISKYYYCEDKDRFIEEMDQLILN